MTTTETQPIISESISGPYMTLTIDPDTALHLGRTRIPATSQDLMVVTVYKGEVVSTDRIPRFEALRAIELLKTLL